MSPFGLDLEKDNSRETRPSHDPSVTTTYIGQEVPWIPGVPDAKVTVLFKQQVHIRAVRLQASEYQDGTYNLQTIFLHHFPSTGVISETVHVSYLYN